MFPKTASVPVLAVVSSENAAAERWRQWRLRSDMQSIAAAKRAYLAFTVIVVMWGMWFGLQVLYPSFWP